MKNILLMIIIILCFGCSGEKSKSVKFSEEQIEQLGLSKAKLLTVLGNNALTLDLNNFLTDNKLSLNDLIYDAKYIPLQTTDESLIAEINKLIYAENYFFILDTDIAHEVLIFSDEGTFIKKLPVGEGPEDIYNPGDIAVDETNRHLIVYNRKGLSFYDYNGNFVKRERMPFNFHNFRVIPNGFIFITVPNQNEHLEEYSDMQLLITDKNFRIISAGLPFHYSKNNSYGITDYTNSYGHDVNFAFKFSDKIYQYVDTLSVQEKYLLNFSKKALPDRYIKNSDDIWNVLKQNDYFYFMGEFVESETHEYFYLHNIFNKKRSAAFIFRDKSSGKMLAGNEIALNSDQFPFFATPLISCRDEFIGSISSLSIPYYLEKQKKEGKSSLFDGLTDDSNPILIKYKLRSID